MQAAYSGRKTSYSVYSGFGVGAAVLAADGHVFKGSNQEVVNYKGTCAERAAIILASVAGKRDKIRKIAVVGGPVNDDLDVGSEQCATEHPITPCGQCCQDLREIESNGDEEITIILAGRNKVMRLIGVRSLLPFAFSIN